MNPSTEEAAREALIEGVKLEARNLMRSDPRVWHEALEAALDKVLPGFWVAARSVKKSPQIVVGHHDKSAFVKIVREYDDLCDPESAETHDEGDVSHLWAVRTKGRYATDEEADASEDGWWISWSGITAETLDAFPITMIQR